MLPLEATLGTYSTAPRRNVCGCLPLSVPYVVAVPNVASHYFVSISTYRKFHSHVGTFVLEEKICASDITTPDIHLDHSRPL
jgi:hypothetical protein